MTTIYDLPVELLILFLKYCDKKSIMRLSEVNRLFYTVTKEKRYNIKMSVHETSLAIQSGLTKVKKVRIYFGVMNSKDFEKD